MALRRNTESALRPRELGPRVDPSGRSVLARSRVYLHLASGDRNREAVQPARCRAPVVLAVEPVFGAVTRALEQHRLLAMRNRTAEMHAFAVERHQRLVPGDADRLVDGIVGGALVVHEPEAPLGYELRLVAVLGPNFLDEVVEVTGVDDGSEAAGKFGPQERECRHPEQAQEARKRGSPRAVQELPTRHRQLIGCKRLALFLRHLFNRWFGRLLRCRFRRGGAPPGGG